MLDELVTTLAGLYDDSDSAKRVATDAGLPTQFIEADGKPIDVWRRIVDQAERRGMLPNLVRIAVREYGSNVTLQRIYGTFLYERPVESIAAVGLGREPRNDGDALARLERSVDKLNQIINGTDWNKGDDGLLTVVKQIKAEVIVLSNDVHEIKRAWRWMRVAIWILLPVVTIMGIALLLAMAGVWGNVG